MGSPFTLLYVRLMFPLDCLFLAAPEETKVKAALNLVCNIILIFRGPGPGSAA